MVRPSWLSTAARRSSEREWTLGHVLEKYRQFENKSPEELAMELGCSLETLEWLALCHRPNEDTFAEDLSAIAERFNVEPNGLASVIRHAESLGVFAARQEDGHAVRETRLMIAAWERDSDDEEFIRDDDFLSAFGETLRDTLNLEKWDAGVEPQRMLARFREQISQSVNKEERVRHIVRTELFPRIAGAVGAPKGAGVYPASPERLNTIHEVLLFAGHVEAVNSMVVSHDSLPTSITQIGLAIVSYGGTSGVFSQRLFRKEMSAQLEGLDAVLALVDQHVMPKLARRHIRAYAERALLLDRAKAEWRIGYGNPFTHELLSGSGYSSLLTESLKLLRRLLLEHPKFVFVSEALDDLGLMTLGNALNAGEYIVIDTLEKDSVRIVDRWEYEDDGQREAFKFVKDCGPEVLRGLFRASDYAPPYLFYAHREHVHIAAHVAMADSILRSERGFPMLLDVADVACRGAFGAEGFMGLVQTPTPRPVRSSNTSTRARGDVRRYGHG